LSKLQNLRDVQKGRSWVVLLYTRLLAGRFQVRILVAEPFFPVRALNARAGYASMRRGMVSSARLRVAIVGGGIGGVAAANALLQRGIDVRVF
jgi:NADPH-dependent 2,4-dienoyl-CoA reductase/sulfur reductase-like enzyme